MTPEQPASGKTPTLSLEKIVDTCVETLTWCNTTKDELDTVRIACTEYAAQQTAIFKEQLIAAESAYSTSLAKLKQQAMDLVEENDNYQLSVERLKEIINQLKSKYEVLRERHEALLRNYSCDSISQLKRENEELKREFAEAKQRVEDFTLDNGGLVKQVEELKREVDAKQSTIYVMTGQLQQSRKQLAAAQLDSKRLDALCSIISSDDWKSITRKYMNYSLREAIDNAMKEPNK